RKSASRETKIVIARPSGPTKTQPCSDLGRSRGRVDGRGQRLDPESFEEIDLGPGQFLALGIEASQLSLAPKESHRLRIGTCFDRKRVEVQEQRLAGQASRAMHR